MTTKTVPKLTGKKINPKFRVHPGLSVTGLQLRQRIKNRSITPGVDGQYSMDIIHHQTSMLSKPEIINKAIENRERIHNLQQQIEAATKAKDKAKQAKLRKDLEELETLRKQKPDPKP